LPISTKYLSWLRQYSNIFIETGANKGKTIDKAISCGFEKIKSVEFYKKLYDSCIEKYKNIDNVCIFYGSSPQLLKKMIFNIDEKILFWLDAHYSGSGTSMDDKICPILDELDVISSHNINNHIILIDDVRLFNITKKKIKHFSGQFEVCLDEVIEKLKKINSDYKILFIDGFIENDVLVALPPDIDEYGLKKCLPPKRIPKQLESQYTLNGSIQVIYKYFNESDVIKKKWKKEYIETFVKKAQLRQLGNYPNVDKMIYELLDRFPIKNKSVLITGSFRPFYEGLCIAFGASKIVVSEYNVPECDDPRILYVDNKNIENSKFDIVLSISSFEHDGLGRYGDKLDPNGDIKAMNVVKSKMSEKSLLFLSVPIGQDCLEWNVHRVYGKIRLPMLIDGFEVVWSSFDVNGNLDKSIYSVTRNNHLMLLKLIS